MSKGVNQNKEILYNALKFQKQSKKSILALMQSFAESTDSIDINSVDEVKKCLENMKSSLDLCNKNISTLETLIKSINNVNIFNNVNVDDLIDSQTTSQLEDLPNTNTVVPAEEVNTDVVTSSEKVETSDTASNNNSNSLEETNYLENTLIISEKDGTITLPYELSTLKQKLNNLNTNYSSIDEIIKKEYSLPISLYKNPFVARFRESYKLMRNKEKSSVKEAFDLGLELMFNYNLHPAIISACKNLDELDIYLDYLDSGETNKFKFFKVLFEIAPTVVKSKYDF